MAAAPLADLLIETKRPAVVADLEQVVADEVQATKGLTAMPVKAGYQVAQKVRPGFINGAINQMLPKFLTQLQPWWDSYSGTGGFGAHLAADGDAVANALLSTTDQQAQASQRAAVRKAYQSLRGRAVQQVRSALPAVGATLEKHLTA